MAGRSIDPLGTTAAPRSIALVTTYYRPVIGGVETAAEQLAQFLVRHGHRVTVLTKRTSAAHPVHEVLDGASVFRTGPIGERRAGGKWLAIPGLLAGLWRHRHAYEVICCIDFRGVGVAALLAGWLVGCPVVFETSTDGTISAEPVRRRLARLGLGRDGLAARVLTWPVRAVCRQADMFICVSRTIQRELLACGVDADRITYLPHAVDTALFVPVTADRRRSLRLALQLPADEPVAVFVGRLSREKGLLELLEAWARLPEPRAHLVVLGPDMPGHAWDIGQFSRDWVKARRLDRAVRFVGGVDPGDVPNWLQAADIAVQPSHFEAFGIAAAEAMAVGLPVVVSDVGGFRDYVQDGVEGFRVPVRDADALSQALQRLLGDAGLRQRLGSAARAKALEFDVTRVLGRFAAILDRLGANASASTAVR